jgi:hypothetical protein
MTTVLLAVKHKTLAMGSISYVRVTPAAKTKAALNCTLLQGQACYEPAVEHARLAQYAAA